MQGCENYNACTTDMSNLKIPLGQCSKYLFPKSHISAQADEERVQVIKLIRPRIQCIHFSITES